MAKKDSKKLSLLAVMLLIGIIPLAVTVLISNVISIKQLKANVQEDIYEKLEVAADGLAAYYGWNAMKGDESKKYDYVDSLKEQGVEMMLYSSDTCLLSSLTDEDGKRLDGAKLDKEIYTRAIKGETYMDHGVTISGEPYYVCYVPIKNSIGVVTGVAFAGETEHEIKAKISSITAGLAILAIVTAAIFAGIVAFLALSISKNLTKVVAATEELAKGNLQVDFEMNSLVKEVEVLADAATHLKENVGNVIAEVAAKAGSLDSSVVRITDRVSFSNQTTDGIVLAVDEMAKGSVEMAESVQNTAAKMQDIGEGITVITSLAKTAEGYAREVKSESQSAKEQLANLMVANGSTIEISNQVMAGINESAAAIENIRKAAEVISEIASQTALLSLNASIEAARAGEAGRGFAVVAGEISNLANQSDASTQEIQKVVEEIINYSEHNVKLAGDIKAAVDNEGTVLTKVNKSFDVVNKMVESTATAVDEITVRAGELDIAKESVLDEVSALSAISEQSAASCQETSAAMAELGTSVNAINQETQGTQSAATSLREAVAYFKV